MVDKENVGSPSPEILYSHKKEQDTQIYNMLNLENTMVDKRSQA